MFNFVDSVRDRLIRVMKIKCKLVHVDRLFVYFNTFEIRLNYYRPDFRIDQMDNQMAKLYNNIRSHLNIYILCEFKYPSLQF